jgi:cell division protein FtsN
MLGSRSQSSSYVIQSSSSTWLKRGIAAAVLVSFGGLIWYVTTQRDSLETESLNPPLVKAPDAAVKERPENPGGMEISGQDKQVFDLLDAAPSVDDEKLIQQLAQQQAAQAAAQAAPAVSATVPMPAQAQAPAVPLNQIPQVAAPVNPVETLPQTTVQPEVVAPTPVATPKEVKPAAKPEKKAEKKAEMKVATSGWAVQLGSFRKKADADAAAAIFQKKHGAALKGLSPLVKSVQVKGDTYYRVHFTGLADKAKADAVCAKLKQAGQGCLNVKL